MHSQLAPIVSSRFWRGAVGELTSENLCQLWPRPERAPGRRIARDLEAAGYGVWIDKSKIKAGEDWRRNHGETSRFVPRSAGPDRQWLQLMRDVVPEARRRATCREMTNFVVLPFSRSSSSQPV